MIERVSDEGEEGRIIDSLVTSLPPAHDSGTRGRSTSKCVVRPKCVFCAEYVPFLKCCGV